VISGGKNITHQAKASQSSRYNDDFTVDLLTDGDLANFAHSAQGDNNPWFKFQFNHGINVEDVRIYNRGGYEGRFRNGRVTFAKGEDAILSMGVSLNGPAVVEGMDPWISPVFKTATAYLQGQKIEADSAPVYTTHLKGADKKIFLKGAEVFNREGHCITCHQPDGKGLPAAQFPPIDESVWITGSEERLIKLTLHGLMGPIEVKGVKYPGVVPMTPFKFLPDDEVAAVLTFVRNTFGNKASVVTPKAVRAVREKTRSRNIFYQPQQLLKEHPH
jgi:mono/diheme cytochrome c family protein